MEAAEAKTIQITVNGEPKTVPDGLNVVQLLASLEIKPDRVAVEMNRSIVRRPDWEKSLVGQGAEIEIVWFVGGG